MITLLLIRHGIAEALRAGRSDAERALTAEGWEKTRAAMAGLVARGHVPDQGVSSPFRRAKETLECLNQATPGGFPVSQWEGLEPGGACGMAEAWLMGLLMGLESGTLAVVSHQPFLSHLIRHLTGREVGMENASCAVLRWSGGCFELTEHFGPAELRGLA